jgi:hypothetical protein
VSAAALSLAVAGTGTISATTTVLMTPEEMDQATKKMVTFRGPGH